MSGLVVVGEWMRGGIFYIFFADFGEEMKKNFIFL